MATIVHVIPSPPDEAEVIGLTEIGPRQSTPDHLGIAYDFEPARPAMSAPLRPTSSPTLHQALLSHHPNERPASSLGPGSSIASWRPRTYQRWKSPALMVVFFLVGFGLSLCHCVFYPSLNGQIVGDSYRQEEKLRVGTACAFLAQLALTSSVWKSYTQWLWRAVYSSNTWTVQGLNKAFSVETSPFALLSPKMFKNFKLGAVMGFFAWCLILPPFFTPATLFVYPSGEVVTAKEQVPYLAIANSSAGSEFAYSPPMNSSTTKFKDDTSRIFTGPRTILTLLASAAASRGEILPIAAPSNHSAYSIDFYGPIVQCKDANATTVALMDRLLRQHMAVPKGTARQVDSAYFGFVPAFNSTGDLVALSEPRYQGPSNAANELWMTFQQYVLDSKRGRVRTRAWQVCRLHNATYDLRFEWDRGVQNLTGSYKVGETVGFPRDRPGDVSDMASHAYAAFMWALTDHLVGSFAWFKQGNISGTNDNSGLGRAAQFGAIESPIRQTSVLGSVDLDVFFDFNAIYGLYASDNEKSLSRQRLQDKALAKNRTLAVLIEELSFNTTVTLLYNRLLTDNSTREVTRWNDVNRYGYLATSLFIPYALANLIAFAAVVLGIVSFYYEAFPDKTFQDIASAAADPHVIRILQRDS
ncbi:hypothetical protein AK830_g2378 [Neonectria ditissima]|uniref:Uncharacterized protein n=1 Tax=Neonectria ditissima TaxID=78410 RepID=A0A0P7BFF9_9HYPO|nr:hypothetical protein AK830_g2378 [Neonectria ditissima]